MTIRVNNGKFDLEWREGMTVADLLRACHFTSPKIVVRVNGVTVQTPAYEMHALHDGDEVQVLHLIGGG